MTDTMIAETVNIKIVGVGGAGCSVISLLNCESMEGVGLLAIDSDASSLLKMPAATYLRVAPPSPGFGWDSPAADFPSEQERNLIRDSFRDTRMVIVVTGLGGRTGSGVTPKVVRIARDLGILTIVLASKPYSFEGKRSQYAEQAVAEILRYCDTLIALDAKKLMTVLGDDVSVESGFRELDAAMRDGVFAIADVLASPGMVNVDFEDVEVILARQGLGAFGSATAFGADRAKNAVNAAIRSPFADPNEIRNAKSVLISITADKSLRMREVNEVMNVIRDSVADDATIIFGAVYDDGIGNGLRVTIVATGLNWTDTSRRRVENGCNVSITLGWAIKSDVVELFSALSELHRACGGTGVVFEEPGISPAKRVAA